MGHGKTLHETSCTGAECEFGAQAKLINFPNLTMAYHMVSGLESVPKRVGRER
jgi:hypothetical protein